MQYQEYLQTDYWKTVAERVKTRAGWRCQVCNSPHDLDAHHRSYHHKGKELDHLDDLTCLCRRCHGLFHGKSDKDKHIEPHSPVNGETVILTAELLGACRTIRGGITNESIYWLGARPPFIAGWFKALRGKTITRDHYLKAVAGRDIMKSKRLRT